MSESSNDRNKFRKEPHALPSGWSWKWQNEVFDIEGGRQPPASHFADVPSPEHVRLIQIRDYYSDSHQTFVPDTRSLSKCVETDVMIARYGASLGRICRGIAGAYNVALAKAAPVYGVETDFLYYLLQTEYFQGPVHGQGARSAQAGFNREGLRSILLPIPPATEQCSIAALLQALDDKIAANAKLAVTGDEWVRASLMDLNASTEETVPVGELIANRKELAEPSTLDPASIYLGLEHIPRRFMWASSAGTAESVTSTKAKFRRGDILFGKLRPYFHKVVAAPYEGVCSTDILVLNPVNRELAGFVLASVASDYVVERATAASEGTRMPRTNWKDLAAIEVPWPGITEAKEFSARVSAVQSSVESLLGENQILAETRDVLLPQLMSGKLRVKEADKVLENAGV